MGIRSYFAIAQLIINHLRCCLERLLRVQALDCGQILQKYEKGCFSQRITYLIEQSFVDIQNIECCVRNVIIPFQSKWHDQYESHAFVILCATCSKILTEGDWKPVEMQGEAKMRLLIIIWISDMRTGFMVIEWRTRYCRYLEKRNPNHNLREGKSGWLTSRFGSPYKRYIFNWSGYVVGEYQLWILVWKVKNSVKDEKKLVSSI